MKKTFTRFASVVVVAAMALVAAPSVSAQAPEKVTGWGTFKLYIDPGHEQRSNQGLWGYSEAEKTVRIACDIKQMLLELTDMPEDCILLCREDDFKTIDLSERQDEANAWGADFYYSIHSDAAATNNSIVTLFGGWKRDGELVEKTPNGGKAYGEILEPNLSRAMRIGSRGNWYDRYFYDRTTEPSHENQYPYLAVNRRSNMPSLLSEGGYHTIAYQQQRNMNDDYKWLEALAAFQSLILYHGGMELPKQYWVSGEITNSENGQAINGAVVTLDGRTYTTDTYESLFHKYTNNVDLLHNGFYLFKDLVAGQKYELKVEAEGYETYTTEITVNGGGEHTSDYITFCDVQLTNASPAKVASVSAGDLEAVQSFEPLTLTFSRNMDRESVESAFSINNRGEVTLSWQNDYTLDIDVANLQPYFTYTITIDGTKARNSQTNQLLDGDGDGVEGGDYVLRFTMAEPDVEAPYVTTTYPEAEGEVVYATRFPITLEFNEPLVWNEDMIDVANLITLVDATGKEYAGKVQHALIGGASIITFLPEEQLPADACILVKFAGGVADLSGNVAEPWAFRFLTEYRTAELVKVMEPMTSTVGANGSDSFWHPQGSGSTKGYVDEGCETVSSSLSPYYDGKGSMNVIYEFDPNDAGQWWYARIHDKGGDATRVTYKKFKAIATMWVYGDASCNEVGVLWRNSDPDAIFHKTERMPVDFRGWRLWIHDTEADAFEQYLTSAAGFTAPSAYVKVDALELLHRFDPEADEEEDPQPAWSGSILFCDLQLNTWTAAGDRTATINDVELPKYDGAAAVAANGVKARINGNVLTVSADEAIDTVAVYDLAGRLVASVRGGSNVATLSVAHLSAGVYVVNVNGTDAIKVVK